MGFKVQLTLQTYLEIMIRTPDKFQGLKFKLFPLKRGAKFGVSALKYIEKYHRKSVSMCAKRKATDKSFLFSSNFFRIEKKKIVSS